MSVRVMSWVWDHAQTTGTDHVVLLAIADAADDDGTDAWPTVTTLARKARVSRPTLYRSLARLQASGVLVVEHQAGGRAEMRADRRPNRYTIVMGEPQSDAPDGVSPVTPRTDDGVSPVTPREAERGLTGASTGSHSCETQNVLEQPQDLVSTSDEVLTRQQSKTGKTPRKRDPLFDAAVDACQIDPAELTRPARGALNAALKDLRAVDATPDEIHQRAEAYRRMWPTVTLTPTALARHWAECVPRAGPVDQRAAEIARVQAWAQSIDREVS